MYENISQAIFSTGATAYFTVVPILRSIAILFMLISTYKLLHIRQDRHKALWLIVIVVSPFLGRIAYEIYRRFINKKEQKKAKSSTAFLILSVLVWVLSVILLIASFVSMGAGYIKSEIDDEALFTYYDVLGNKYELITDIPLHDKQGNTYFYEPGWFSVGTYTDQNGTEYDGSYCYISEDGYFYYDKNDELQPYEDTIDYYTDGETVFYSPFGRIYWEEDGTMCEIVSKSHNKLFDFDE